MSNYPETSIPAIFQNRASTYGDRTLVSYKKDGVYVELSWRQMDEMVKDLWGYLVSKGIGRGDKVALFSPNQYEWWVADLAILAAGAVNVPIYATNSAEEARYVIENSDSKLCFVGTRDHMDRVLQVRNVLPGLEEVVLFEESDVTPEGVTSLHEAFLQGRPHRNLEEMERRISGIAPSDMATIIYTSGTTGNPKGVMLSHSNFVANLHQLDDVAGHIFDDKQVLLSFLPLSHSLERTVGYYMAIFKGARVTFAEDFSKLQENLQEVRPSVIVSVPRLYEKVHAGILAKVSGASPFKKFLFNWAMGVARQNLPYVCNDQPRKGLFALKYRIADKLIFSKLKDALGLDNIVFALSGGGPLAVSDAEFFVGMGVPILEGFGLTETTPVTNANRPGRIKLGRVGAAVKDTEIKIEEDGEVLIKGPQVMMGYYRNEEATREVMTPDGFFRTGDIGTLDEDGYLQITGRIKDIIITSGGKNISPQNIENRLKESRFIEQVAVIGDRRKYLSALVVPAFEELESWAGANGIAFSSHQDLIKNGDVEKLIGEEIDKHTEEFARVEKIKKFRLLDAEWSQDGGELTPTLKVKRRIVNDKYTEEIESMYPSG